MTQTICYKASNGQSRELTISDSASWIIRFESEFGKSFNSEDFTNPSKIPLDLGLRLAFAMAKPRPNVGYAQWIDNSDIGTEAMVQISEGCVKFFADSQKNA